MVSHREHREHREGTEEKKPGLKTKDLVSTEDTEKGGIPKRGIAL
jgi:hypothetical protein